MLIQCTKALLHQIGLQEKDLISSEGYEQFPNRFMAWHAHVVHLYKRKAIILMNNETRYSVVIYRLRKKDLANIKELIREAIATALRMEGVRQEVIEAYFTKAGDIYFSKTSSKSMVAKMNNAVREVEFMREFVDTETTIQRYISIVTGRLIQGSGTNGEAFYPIEKMLHCLSIVALDNSDIGEILDIDLYQLKIKMNLEGHDIWRRVLVPSTFSFRFLHNVIQTVFDWQNYHLHEFEGIKGETEKPIRILMDDDPETLQYLDFDKYDLRQERFVALEDIFSIYDEVNYMYDFGDGWEHTITLEKVVKSTTFRATYVEGNGERPPEDVGGITGFENYLWVMANKNDPMHEQLKAWAENQKERQFSREKINRRLRIANHGYRYSMY